ncbi:hypothetical protein E3P81_03377 [Wallemia ichthyophaga]|nr:hypothetical protein E3P97_03414 [Wallemia ichthyophaga]TIB29351.1 hypothetical protein E3P85_03239 [Wallemia ichthyophaga]TIB44785.1 hypothetical protein E3P82_03382 [Wallemia ichthyophaga]TIB47209.1 hypothetical protein E3P81_03377 [Wallemia ichthyophaga]TIB50168.1 hypothetical protein E3P80_03386 [Wallemia ichthyophaga]
MLSVDDVAHYLHQLPGSSIFLRYVRSSYQNDPWRSLLELLLFLFALRVWLSKRTRGDSEKGFIRLSEGEIDELIDDWQPEPLVPTNQPHKPPPTILGPPSIKPRVLLPQQPIERAKQVTNLVSYNFLGLLGDQRIKDAATNALRVYGVGSCGPPGFYGNMDAHIALEKSIAQTLGTESAIIYSQGFATIVSVIPTFAKRGDIIVADEGCSFAIRKGLQISRSTVRWYKHNDMNSLEAVLDGVNREAKRRKSPLTRRFICSEGIFQNDGTLANLKRMCELKRKYKYRLILDESYSFGVVGSTGRGLTELFDVPARDVDILVGSMANTLGGAGGFCAGESVVVEHQRINSAAFIFSASLPPIMAVSANKTLSILNSSSGPSLVQALQSNIATFRNALTGLDSLQCASHPLAPIQHVFFTPSKEYQVMNMSSAVENTDEEKIESIWEDIAEDALSNGVFVTVARHLRGQEGDIGALSAGPNMRVPPGGATPPSEPRPSIKVAISAALSKKETEKAALTLKNSVNRVLKRRS